MAIRTGECATLSESLLSQAQKWETPKEVVQGHHLLLGIRTGQDATGAQGTQVGEKSLHHPDRREEGQ